jgi:hypothetical protein
MKRTSMLLLVCLLLSSMAVAQQAPADEVPTKADIEKYYEVMHVRELMKNVMEATSKQMRQVTHEELQKRIPNASPEMLGKLDKLMDDLLKQIDFEELLQAMTPVYQKHLTKSDLNAMIAFYSSPAGQKILKELPAITAEAMNASTGIIRKQMDMVMEKTQELVASMEKDTGETKKQPN